MRYLMTGLVVLLLSVSLITAFSCAPGAEFDVANLTISPAQVIEGSPVSVSVELTNTSHNEGSFDAKLKLDGALAVRKSIALAAGQTATISFTLDIPAAGTHEVELNGLTNKFKVLTPPVFANLVVIPPQPQVGDNITISADVTNIGEVSGNYTLVLKLNETEEQTKTVELNALTTVPLAFNITKNELGIYTVGLGNISASFTLLRRAAFTLSNLVISPAQAIPGRQVSITCRIANSGEVDGYHPVHLSVDGVKVDSQDVSVAAGATKTVTFGLTLGTSGVHNVSIDNLYGTLEISEGLLPALYAGDTWVFKEAYKGNNYVRTETITGREGMEGKECYVKSITFDPPMDGWIPEETQRLDKASLEIVASVVSGRMGGVDVMRWIVYSINITGIQWPYQVGNNFTVDKSWERTDYIDGQPFADTGHSATDYRCTDIEDVTVEAGTFRCLKVVAYQYGQPAVEYWYSFQAKTFVKTRGTADAHTIELLSYIVK